MSSPSSTRGPRSHNRLVKDDLAAAAKYGQYWADIYDSCYPFDETAAAAVDALQALSNNGRILELAIGSGRLALPLSQRGIEIHGIDASQAMVDLLRAKPGGEEIPVTIGNFRDVPAQGLFDLVFIACNTIFGLLSQEEQLACFRNVAARLVPSGRFVVECFVPTPRRLSLDGQSVQPWMFTDDTALFHLLQHDPVAQTIDGQTIRCTNAEGVRMFPSHIRYIWPSEMDLMARLAGLRLAHRWAGWDAAPFTANSTSHVSTYELEGSDA